ncbi:hypothetical protein SAMN02800687_0673 [Curtobacterium sp. UNCCL20]|nr:hypothetical protein SAMN02800687_0673 [Curtobacterium sp. UNCCL20]
MTKSGSQRRASLSLMVTIATYFLAIVFIVLPLVNANWARASVISFIAAAICVVWGSVFIWVRKRNLRQS